MNKLGRTISPQPNWVAKELWLWCMERNILLKAQHLPGVLNTIADDDLRVIKGCSDWMLFPAIFHRINHRLRYLEMDLFYQKADTPTASLCQLETRSDGHDHRRIYNDLGPAQIICQTRQQQATSTSNFLVASVWKTQVWYPVLLEMLIRIPPLIPQRKDLIQATHQ